MVAILRLQGFIAFCGYAGYDGNSKEFYRDNIQLQVLNMANVFNQAGNIQPLVSCVSEYTKLNNHQLKLVVVQLVSNLLLDKKFIKK